MGVGDGDGWGAQRQLGHHDGPDLRLCHSLRHRPQQVGYRPTGYLQLLWPGSEGIMWLDFCDLFERRKLLMNPLKLKCNLIVNVLDNRCVNNAWTVRASNLGRMGTLWWTIWRSKTSLEICLKQSCLRSPNRVGEAMKANPPSAMMPYCLEIIQIEMAQFFFFRWLSLLASVAR